MNIFVFVVIILLSLFDNSLSSLFFLLTIYICGFVLVLTFPLKSRSKVWSVFNVSFVIYIVLAYITSLSFSESSNFLVSDSSRYIETYINRTYYYYNLQDWESCYLQFSDSNLLYNSYLNIMAMFANNHLDGMTIYCMTLLQTVWGILSSVLLFKIFVRYFDVDISSRYSLVFALCSLFLFYSTVIIRDIVICFLYLWAFDVITQKFSLLGIGKLIIIMFISWGIRLYSGIFIILFIAYYVYIRLRNSSFKNFATIIYVVVLVCISGTLLTSSLMEQTMTELQGYEELSAERSGGGMVSKLQSLPPVIKQISIILFTMIRPLPPLSIYIGVETFSHFLMSTMFLIAGFFWFVIFYSLCYQLFVKKYISKIPFEKLLLLFICLVFMMANASHPDIRRMLPVFPIFYMQYAEICKNENAFLLDRKISINLIIFYVMMALVMYVII